MISACPDHQQINVPIPIEIDDQHLLRTVSSRCEDIVTDPCKGSVAIVVDQCIRAIGIHAEHIEIPIVIGIEHRAVHGLVHAITHGGIARLLPARLQLHPQLIGAGATQVRIDQAIVIQITPEHREHILDCTERMVTCRPQDTLLIHQE